MAVRTDTLPSQLLRWLLAPAALAAMCTGFFSALFRRFNQPALPRMSEEWLRNNVDRRFDQG